MPRTGREFPPGGNGRFFMNKNIRNDIAVTFFSRCLLGFLPLLPLGPAIALCRALAGFYFLLDRRHRSIARVNLNIAFPEKTDREKRRIAKESYQNLGELLAVFSHFPALASPARVKPMVEYQGLEHYEALRASKKNILFLTGHICCWEFLSFSFALLHHPLHFVVKPFKHPRLDALITRYRTLSGNRVIPKKNALRTILRLLAHGEMVGLLVDQNTTAADGVFVPLFGKLATMNISLPLLAQRSGAAVLPVFLVPAPAPGTARYCISIRPPLVLQNTGDRQADLYVNAQRCAAALEEVVRQYPGRWIWAHKRWKTRPAEDPADPYAGEQ